MPYVEHHYGAFIVHRRGGSELVQTDYDYPRLAEELGWNMCRVQKDKRTGKTRFLKRAPNRGQGCDHSSTDGTVNCAECGITASEFITAASDFISDHC